MRWQAPGAGSKTSCTPTRLAPRPPVQHHAHAQPAAHRRRCHPGHHCGAAAVQPAGCCGARPSGWLRQGGGGAHDGCGWAGRRAAGPAGLLLGRSLAPTQRPPTRAMQPAPTVPPTPPPSPPLPRRRAAWCGGRCARRTQRGRRRATRRGATLRPTADGGAQWWPTPQILPPCLCWSCTARTTRRPLARRWCVGWGLGALEGGLLRSRVPWRAWLRSRLASFRSHHATAPPAHPQVPGCALWFNGSFYDNIEVGRRGVTSLNWPKPKIKVDSKQGAVRGRVQLRPRRVAWHARPCGGSAHPCLPRLPCSLPAPPTLSSHPLPLRSSKCCRVCRWLSST